MSGFQGPLLWQLSGRCFKMKSVTATTGVRVEDSPLIVCMHHIHTHMYVYTHRFSHTHMKCR